MSYIELTLAAISLAMDAFAVSICNGLAIKKLTWKKLLPFGLYFGFFQALMPVLGYLLGEQFAALLHQFEHWIAFGVLAFLGGRMILGALHQDEEQISEEPTFSAAYMLPLALATSIDALAMGVTFAVMEVNIVIAALLIGVITAFISALGVLIGQRFGASLKSKAELAGGIVLVLIGLRIFLNHYGIGV